MSNEASSLLSLIFLTTYFSALSSKVEMLTQKQSRLRRTLYPTTHGEKYL